MNKKAWVFARVSVLSFPIAGLVAIIGSLTPGIGINPASDPSGFAQAAGPVGIVNLAGLIAFIFLLFGFQFLDNFLSDMSVKKWSHAGMILSTAGGALFATFLGIFAIVAPVAAREYL